MFTVKEIFEGVLFLMGMLCSAMSVQGLAGKKRWGIPAVCIAIIAWVVLWFVMS